MKCPECGAVLEYKCIHTFGDANLGTSDEWYQCPECGTQVELSEVQATTAARNAERSAQVDHWS